jgi:hypothetical protein
MENEATQSIIAMGIAYVTVGILLRVIIILTMVMIVRSLVTLASCVYNAVAK